MKKNKKPILVATSFLLAIATSNTFAAKWTPVTGDALTALYTDTVLKGKKWTAHYCANGKGKLIAGGETRPRNWQAKRDDQICVTRRNGSQGCYTYVKSSKKQNKFKATRVGDGLVVRFTLKKQKPGFCAGS